MQGSFQIAITIRVTAKLTFLQTNEPGNYLCESTVLYIMKVFNQSREIIVDWFQARLTWVFEGLILD